MTTNSILRKWVESRGVEFQWNHLVLGGGRLISIVCRKTNDSAKKLKQIHQYLWNSLHRILFGQACYVGKALIVQLVEDQCSLNKTWKYIFIVIIYQKHVTKILLFKVLFHYLTNNVIYPNSNNP